MYFGYGVTGDLVVDWTWGMKEREASIDGFCLCIWGDGHSLRWGTPKQEEP